MYFALVARRKKYLATATTITSFVNLHALTRLSLPFPLLCIAVARDATDEDIKRAYRSLAQTTHPDKHSSPALREVRGERAPHHQTIFNKVCPPYHDSFQSQTLP
jgi:preprotein translocase subunit Sec63